MTSNSATRQDRLPAIGRGMPTFTLTDTAGIPRRLWNYKQRHPVLLTVSRDPRDPLCHEWLVRLRAARHRLDEHCTAVLVVAPETPDRLRELHAVLDLPFTVLADPDAGVASRYLTPAPEGEHLAVYLADRYLQCLGRWLVRAEQDLPHIDDILAALALADQDDCACGLPAWPED